MDSCYQKLLGAASLRMFGAWTVGLCVACAALIGCQKGGDATSNPPAPGKTEKSQSGDSPSQGNKAAGQVRTTSADDVETLPTLSEPAEPVLKKMVAAYQAAKTYRDQGELKMRGTENGETFPSTPVPYSVAFTRPNQLRLSVYSATIVSDGRQVYGFSPYLPGQVARRDAPQQMTIKDLFSDEILMDSLVTGPAKGVSWAPIQMLLLTAEDPLKTLLTDCQRSELLSPMKIDENECDRARLTRTDGTAVLWIDRQSHILRRIELPIDELNRDARTQGAEIQSITIDFNGAKFDAAIEPAAFQFEMPKDAEARDFLVASPLLLLGKPAQAFSFVGLDDKKVDLESLKGKVAVLDFWATGCEPCQVSLPILEKVYQKYKDNEKVVFYAVGVDNSEVPNSDLTKKFSEFGVSIPILRDPDFDARDKLGLTAIPATYMLGSDGTIQDLQIGFNPQNLEAEYERKIEALLAGKSVVDETREKLAQRHRQHVAELDKFLADGLYVQASVAPPPSEVAPASKPKTFALRPMGRSADVKSPGNILVVPQKSGPPKLLVMENVKAVVEIAPDGSAAARYPLDIGEQELVTVLRTAVDGDGKRYYVGSGPMQQRVHVFDENFKLVSHFPKDYPNENEMNQGVGDVQIGDLDGDGKLEVLVGYYSTVGMKVVSLEGEPIAANRGLAEVSRIVLLGKDDDGKQLLLCTSAGALVQLDSQLNRLGELKVSNRLVNWFDVADLDGNKTPDICCLCFLEMYEQIAVGTNPQGEELWTYQLPKGLSIAEPILAGNVKPSGAGQWILPGADGSIHILAADGKPLDQFNYGKLITGIATLLIDRKPVLMISTKEGLDAYWIESPGQ